MIKKDYMNDVTFKEKSNRRCDQEIKLISPKNGAEIELTNEVVLSFIKGYERGLSVSYAFEGDNYEPNCLRLEWQASFEDYSVYVAYEPTFKNPYIFHVKGLFIDLYTHFYSKTVYWKVVTNNGLCESSVFTFSLERLVENVYIEGVVNARDIGGYVGLDGKKVKRGIIYRGAHLDQITDNGKAFASVHLKICVDLDLRNEGEGSASQGYSPLGDKVKHILRCGCMYTGNNWSGVAHVGKEGVDIPEGARKLVEELLVFADSDNFPLYTHCVLGRDRTGTLIGVLLALCGVSKRDIMLDYELSFFSKAGGTDKDNALAIIGYFEKVLDYIETFNGSDLREKTEDFLKLSGMSETQILAIRKNVLE